MNRLKKRIVSLLALALCIAMAAVFAFAGCEEESAEAGSVGWTEGSLSEFVSGGSYTVNERGEKVFDEIPEITVSEVITGSAKYGNDAATNVSEPDGNGISTCTVDEEDMYLTLAGGLYYFYPYCYTLAPISMTADEPEIQVSLIFNREPERKDDWFNDTSRLKAVEVSSLTGEPLDVTSFTYRTEIEYQIEPHEDEYTVFVISNQDGQIFNAELYRKIYGNDTIMTDMTKTYSISYSMRTGYTVFRIELGNGNEYWYGVSFVDDKIMYTFLLDDDEETEEDIEGDEDIDEDILSSLA